MPSVLISVPARVLPRNRSVDPPPSGSRGESPPSLLRNLSLYPGVYAILAVTRQRMLSVSIQRLHEEHRTCGSCGEWPPGAALPLGTSLSTALSLLCVEGGRVSYMSYSARVLRESFWV
jgi:hypothetical protein